MADDDVPVLNLGKYSGKGTDTLRLRLDLITAKLGYPDNWNNEDAPFADWFRSNKSTNVEVAVNVKVKGLKSNDSQPSPKKFTLHYQHIHTKLHYIITLPKKSKSKEKYVIQLEYVISATDASPFGQQPDAVYTAEIPITDDWFEDTDDPLARGGDLVIPLAGKFDKNEDYSDKKFSGTAKYDWPMTEGTGSWLFCVLQRVDVAEDNENKRISDWMNILDSSAAQDAEESLTILWSEHPQIPEGRRFLEALEIFLKTKHFTPVDRVNTERYAMLMCHYGDYEDVLKICLKYAYNQLYTATEAYKICDIRADRQLKKKNDLGGLKVSYLPDWFKMKSTVVGHMRTLLDFSVGLQLHTMKRSSQNTFREYCELHVKGMYMDNVFENNIMEYFKNDVLQISCHPVLTQYVDKAMELESPYPLCPWGGNVSPWVLYYVRLAFYIIFLVLFFLLIGHKSLEADTYQLQWAEYLNGELLGTINDVSDGDGVYAWVQGLIPALDNEYFYLVHPTINMRQFRSSKVPCPRDPNTTCWSIYPDMSLDKSWAGTTWQTVDGIPNFIGSHYQRYPPVGYTAFLTGNETQVGEVIAELNASDWFDGGTRAVFVDFFVGATYANMYARVVVMFEFFPTGNVNIKSAVDTLWSASPPYFIYVITIYLLVHVFGLAVQEFYELYLNSVYSDSRVVFGEWEKSLLYDRYENSIFGGEAENPPEDEPTLTPGIAIHDDFHPDPPSTSFVQALQGYFSDVFNYVDIGLIAIIAFYLITYVVSRNDANLLNFTPGLFDYYFALVKAAEIFGFIAAVVVCLRLLSFLLLFGTMSTFLLGLLQMMPVVAQFLIGFIVIIISFAAGLNVLYGETSALWSGGNEYVDSALNAFTGIGNQVPNNVFQPYVLYWLGDITMFVYFIICGIVLVNMLIAMMGAKFGDLTEKHLLLRKQQFYKGAALIELEHAILPAPFNVPHLIFLLLTKSCWPFGEFDRWMYVVLPNPFVFTGQLRDMWCKYLEWKENKKKKKKDGDNNKDDKNDNKGDKSDDDESEEEESEEEESDDDEYFREKDQYDANADEDELNAYVEKLSAIKPFVDKYFRRWHKRYMKAIDSHRRRQQKENEVGVSDKDDDEGNISGKSGDGNSSKKKEKVSSQSSSPRQQPKKKEKTKKSPAKDDDDKDPDYVAMTDVKSG